MFKEIFAFSYILYLLLLTINFIAEKYDVKQDRIYETTTAKFTKNEKHQLCESLATDDVKNALLKFGLVLHFFEDVSKFKMKMKSLSKVKKQKEKDNLPKTNSKMTDKKVIFCSTFSTIS